MENFKTVSKSQESLDACVKYSENPDAMLKVVSQCVFEYCEQGVRKFFSDDKDSRMVRTIRITRGNKTIDFDFGMSINDTEIFTLGVKNDPKDRTIFGQERDPFKTLEAKKGIEREFLYAILCCVKSDSYCADTFEDWADEFGYDTDSRKALDLYLRCQKQAAKIRKIFTSEELETFPS